MSENVNVVGPDFLTLQVRDLERSRRFYTDIVGFHTVPTKVPNAAVLGSEPIKVALRQATDDLDAVSKVAWGVVIWIKAEDPDKVAAKLAEHDVPIVKPLCDGSCGREFIFEDPDGYRITIYEGQPS
ncbi:glyoxalase/bleomycin resistance protein/dioxygenase superfamily protein [Haloactinospora alba]|uniref:Glyoxalase/bleomycin resistance protein/dioxygenase superfamily protein n=1 Tax=Haloactinospora alba TaxID=405555 RepID=A0A543N900_9ACTN|nr:VOC family protein [Haloactinospora alba]TQN28301.1 glyoxalase/bleomycin resistance protein/dioxygenase superfamily protein [Haloactinospora alba]